MAEQRITIDVRRSDGEVTRISGSAGLAIATTIPGDAIVFTRETNTPAVSLRASSPFQLAVMLGALIASMEAVAPGISLEAVRLSKLMDARRPELMRRLPEVRHG